MLDICIGRLNLTKNVLKRAPLLFWDQKPVLLQSTAALLSNSGKKCCLSAVSSASAIPLLMVEVSAFTGDISTI